MRNLSHRFALTAGTMPRPELLHTPICYTVTQEWNLENTVRYEIHYATEPGSDVRAYLFIPKDKSHRHAAVICPHPTNGALGGAGPAGLGGMESRFYALELAKLGYVTLAPDTIYYGASQHANPYAAGYASGTMKVVFDHIRGIDFLSSLSCVDPDRIGCIGHSLGAQNAVFTSFFDERIKVCVASCGLCAHMEYVKTNDRKMEAWAQDVYMPLIGTRFDFDPGKMPWDYPELASAIAPRHLFISTCKRDTNINYPGAKCVIDECRCVYEKLGIPERFDYITPDDVHNFPPEARRASYDFIRCAIGN